MAEKLPEGYGAAAAPEKGAAPYAKKKTRRKRAARILRRKKGGYLAFVKKYLKTHKGATIVDAAKAWREQKKA